MPWGPVGPVGPGMGQGGGQGGQPQARLSAPQRKRFMGLSSRGYPWEGMQYFDTKHSPSIGRLREMLPPRSILCADRPDRAAGPAEKSGRET